MVLFAIRCFLLGGARAILGWLLLGLFAIVLLPEPRLLLAVLAISVIGGLCGAWKRHKKN